MPADLQMRDVRGHDLDESLVRVKLNLNQASGFIDLTRFSSGSTKTVLVRLGTTEPG